jgi:hypothetical protein
MGENIYYQNREQNHRIFKVSRKYEAAISLIKEELDDTIQKLSIKRTERNYIND